MTCFTASVPLTGFWSCTALSGLFAAEMRWAGFDHLVINGGAATPVYLFIRNGEIEIKDGAGFGGHKTAEACARIRSDLGDEAVKIVAARPAGAHPSRFAAIADDTGRVAGHSGMGAVLGSKNVVALACRGTLDVEIKFPDRAIEYRLGSDHAPAFAALPGSAAVYRGKPGVVAHRALSLRLLDCLGDRTCAGVCPATGRIDTARVGELLRINTGLSWTARELIACAYRCYAMERLYNLRIEKEARQTGQPQSGRLRADWDANRLKAFRRAVARYHRRRGWDRLSLVKKKVLGKLGIESLWEYMK